AVCIARRAFWVYLASYLLGAAFFLTHFQWLYVTTPPGYMAGSLYLAFYFPLAAWPLRHLYRQRGMSMALTFPIVWTAFEWIRSQGTVGFPWFLLGHSQIRLLTIVQIADLSGVYGVSFLVAMVNGWLADLLFRPILFWKDMAGSPARKIPAGTVVMVLFLGFSVIYGRIQIARTPRELGPRISVIQGDFVLTPDDPGPVNKRKDYLTLLHKASVDRPAMLVLPETPWDMYLNREIRELPDAPIWEEIGVHRRARLRAWSEFSRIDHDYLKQLAERFDAAIVTGSLSMEPQPDAVYPDIHRYNSAFVYYPGESEPARYDKIHRVLFGEYVPFRYSRWFNFLYWWLNRQTPWGADGFEYSITAGTEYKVFTLPERVTGTQDARFGVTICYEDAMPYVFRRFVLDCDGRKHVDFMLNISNDGWFGRGTQQPQHLVNCAFRAIENRIGIARSVNTGVSGYINSDGSWHGLILPEAGRLRAGGTGYRTDCVNLDKRVTVYSRYGDAFAVACTIFMLVAVIDATVVRRRSKRQQPQAKQKGVRNA
ncbi:MAG: apolipoprotein N-acyltransferase, partial [Phycisphaerales bacterium]|nr:apolipoprotein N-acyltransferase [Phycisphaerales bacterium]